MTAKKLLKLKARKACRQLPEIGKRTRKRNPKEHLR
jgi:hypothetical protein